MGGGEGDPDWDKVTLESGDKDLSYRLILSMLLRMQDAQKAGGLSQDDMLFLVQNWIELGMHFQRGGEANRLKVGVVADARKQALAYAKSKGGLLADWTVDPKHPMVRQTYDQTLMRNPPKPSAEFYKSLNNLMNNVDNDHYYQRMGAYSDAEGTFAVLYFDYRIKLAADKDAETIFRQSVARLRNGHSIH